MRDWVRRMIFNSTPAGVVVFVDRPTPPVTPGVIVVEAFQASSLQVIAPAKLNTPSQATDLRQPVPSSRIAPIDTGSSKAE